MNNKDCGIVRDLLPLYADGVASEDSSHFIEGHLKECQECTDILKEIKNEEIVDGFISEKGDIISHQKKLFKRKSLLTGGIIAGLFLIPVTVCFIVNIAAEGNLSWFFTVLASLITMASITVVPLTVPVYKGFYTFISFCASLILLFGVCCINTGGRWFAVASASCLFGVSLIFLPFLTRKEPLSRLLKNQKALFVMVVDTLLYALMILSPAMFTATPSENMLLLSAGISAPFLILAWGIFALLRYAGKSRMLRAGLCVMFSAAVLFFAEAVTGVTIGNRAVLPVFRPTVWNVNTTDDNVKWIILIAGLVTGAVLVICSVLKGRKSK